MSNWIDKMESADEQKARDEKRQTDLRLHRAEVIRAKAPMFWEALVEQMQADCGRLRTKFANDLSRQCELARDEPNWVTLQGHTTTRNILRLRLDLYGLGISQEFFTGEQNRQKQTELLSFDIDKNEQLYLRAYGETISAPEVAAETFIKRVIRNAA